MGYTTFKAIGAGLDIPDHVMYSDLECMEAVYGDFIQDDKFNMYFMSFVRGCLKAPFGGCRILAEAVGIFAVYGAVIPQWVVEVSKFKAFVINLVQ